MKKGYLILLLFVIWCVVSTIWYLFAVKGLSTDPSRFTPQPTLLGIIEILIMILGGCLIGFALAWVNRQFIVEQLTDTVRNNSYQQREQEEQIAQYRSEIDTLNSKIYHTEQQLEHINSSRNVSNQQLQEVIDQQEALQKKNKELEARVAQQEGDVTSAKFRVRVLEGDLGEKDKLIKKLTAELAEANDNKPSHRDWSDHPFVRPVEDSTEDDKDDLTKIKGIGPAFQKKLNSLDIYSFRQISELDGEGVERLAEVIEVFPERIHRDNWIGQATKLYLKKIGREE